MDETMPDAAPLSQRFLASLASFMENEHELLGEGDISSKVKGAIAPQAGEGIAESKAAQGRAANPPGNRPPENYNANGTQG